MDAQFSLYAIAVLHGLFSHVYFYFIFWRSQTLGFRIEPVWPAWHLHGLFGKIVVSASMNAGGVVFRLLYIMECFFCMNSLSEKLSAVYNDIWKSKHCQKLSKVIVV